MKELLFVGGPANGKRIEVRDGLNTVRITDTNTGFVFEYKRERICEGEKVFELMFNKQGRGIIEALLAGYCK